MNKKNLILTIFLIGFVFSLPVVTRAASDSFWSRLFNPSMRAQTRYAEPTSVVPTRTVTTCSVFNGNNYVPSGAILDNIYAYDLNNDGQNEYVVKFKRQLVGSVIPDFGYKLMACENSSWVPRKEDTSFGFQEYNFDLLTSPRALFISTVASGAGTATEWEISDYKGTGFGISTNGGSVVRDQALTSKCLVYQGYNSVQVIQPNKIQEILPGYRPTDSRCCPTGQSITANYSFNLYGTGYGLQIDSISGNSSCGGDMPVDTLASPPTTTLDTSITIKPLTYTQTLRPGATGTSVTALQNVLKQLGYTIPTNELGKYGIVTSRAIETIQKRAGLKADFVVGKGTVTAINQLISKGAPVEVVAVKCVAGITPPWIKITSPFAGTQLIKGQTYTIKWASCNVPSNANINLKLGASEYFGTWDHGLSISNQTNTGITQATVENFTPIGLHKIHINANWNNTNFVEAVSDGLYDVRYINSVCNLQTQPSVFILVPMTPPATQSLQGLPQVLWDDCNLPTRYRANVELENVNTGVLTNLISDTVAKEYVQVSNQKTFAQFGLSAGTYRYKITIQKALNGVMLSPLIKYSGSFALQ